jgi:hypothetical protein
MNMGAGLGVGVRKGSSKTGSGPMMAKVLKLFTEATIRPAGGGVFSYLAPGTSAHSPVAGLRRSSLSRLPPPEFSRSSGFTRKEISTADV